MNKKELETARKYLKAEGIEEKDMGLVKTFCAFVSQVEAENFLKQLDGQRQAAFGNNRRD